MNKNLGIILVSIGLIIVIILGGFLLMQVNNKNAAANPKTNGNQQTSPSTTTIGNTPNTTTSTSKTYDVKIMNFEFSPSTLTIKKGDKVTWTNQDSVHHTILSDSGTEINSPSLSSGESYSKTFDNIGSYNYHCSIHPSMKGEIIVE
ncbi:MAG: cupredoxin family copper-binding protein [Candidatus Nanoarchaeia archaeon]|nr:cupredoxin family copper-binding protein [Candidatus Nanoarchaeia archaeon]